MAFPLFAPRLPRGVGSGNVRSPAGSLGNRFVGAPASPEARGRAHARARDVAALLLWTGAVFLVLALASYAPNAHEADANVVGVVGEECARGLVSLIGVVAWAIPLEMALLCFPLVRGRESQATPARLAGDLLIVV